MSSFTILAILAVAGIVAATQQWLERAVIGLNLCPFAKATIERTPEWQDVL